MPAAEVRENFLFLLELAFARREFVARLGELFSITLLEDFRFERRGIERLAERLRGFALLRELALEPLDGGIARIGLGWRGLVTVIRRGRLL